MSFSNPPTQPSTSQFVRSLRRLTGLTQAQFGQQVGVSYETISRWENGRMQPSPLALKQLQHLAQTWSVESQSLFSQFLVQPAQTKESS